MERDTDWSTLAVDLPGPASLAAIRATDPTRLSPTQLVDAIRISERLSSHLAGLQTVLLTEFARPGRSGDISSIVEAFTDFGGSARTGNGTLDTELLHTLVTDHAHGMAAAEIAAALNISPVTARHRIEKAVDLHDGLPDTLTALTEGRIDRGRAAMIAEHTGILDDPNLRTAVEAAILPLAETRTAGRLRPLVDRAVITADPDAAERRVKKARRGREVTHLPSKDDMSVIRATLPADGAVTVYTLIDLIAAATKTPGDDRGIGERRADALTDIAGQLLSHGHLDLRGLLRNPDDEEDDDWFDGGTAHPGDYDPTDPDDDYDTTDRTNAWKNVDSWGTDSENTDYAMVPANSPATGATLANSRQAAPATNPGSAVQGSPQLPIVTPPRVGSRPARKAPNPPLRPSGNGSGRLLTRQGRRPHLTLTMSMSTLMGLDRLPGHLEGFGAITAELAHAIAAAAASLSLVIIDPETGSPLHAGGRKSYRPHQEQRDITSTLFDTCRFPSCRQPSWRCDLDHRQPFNHQDPDSGGDTCNDNLDPYCRRHHLLKHHTEWTPKRQPDGTILWQSPTRHTYIDHPRELTLPGEFLNCEPAPRTNIGLADLEHQQRCATPLPSDDPTPPEFACKQRENTQLQERVRERLSYLKEVIARPPAPPDHTQSSRDATFTIEYRAEMLRKEFEASRSCQTIKLSTLPDDEPPF